MPWGLPFYPPPDCLTSSSRVETGAALANQPPPAGRPKPGGHVRRFGPARSPAAPQLVARAGATAPGTPAGVTYATFNAPKPPSNRRRQLPPSDAYHPSAASWSGSALGYSLSTSGPRSQLRYGKVLCSSRAGTTARAAASRGR